MRISRITLSVSVSHKYLIIFFFIIATVSYKYFVKHFVKKQEFQIKPAKFKCFVLNSPTGPINMTSRNELYIFNNTKMLFITLVIIFLFKNLNLSRKSFNKKKLYTKELPNNHFILKNIFTATCCCHSVNLMLPLLHEWY